MSNRVPVPVGQRRLATAWFVGSGLVFLLLVVQSLNEHYGDKTSEAWGWFLPTVMPTLTLITGAIAVTRPESPATVGRFAYHLSFWLSVFYLVLVIATIMYQPFAGLKPSEMIEFMRTSNLWLGAVQTLLGISLGVFFGTRKSGGSAG